MTEPIVLVNLKCYASGTGPGAIALAQACEERGARIAVQTADIYRVCQHTDAEVWAQHVDPIEFGSFTGATLPEAVKQAGAVGTIINHSEHQLPPHIVEAAIERCKEVGLRTMVCADSLEKAKVIADFEPDYIALELPELIGGDVSITSADPDLIKQAVEELGDNVLVGAGVHSGEDLAKSLEFGAQGVLVASAVVKKTRDPRRALKELYSGLR